MADNATANQLVNEKSPYLLKHAENPVHWYPWGQEAFTLARRQKKPIFLSIGYSTCHWCNVMEEESFSDPEVAAMMNDIFISIKVDREERPDIDQVYMQVCQMLSPSCGWPLTIFMTPEKEPFFAGTYFPKEDRFGRPGILSLMQRVKDLWQEDNKKIMDSAKSIINALIEAAEHKPGEALGVPHLDAAYKDLANHFDTIHGGFGDSMKFPRPHNFMFLLRYWKNTGEANALVMVEKTLAAMRNGGIYDQLGFGFHRYSTDPSWLLPHFEKMLYDQALITLALSDAYQATGKKEYAQTIHEIISYVTRDMTSPAGAFFSAESADSEGKEGKFYLWHEKEVEELLGKTTTQSARKIFNFSAEGNFIDPLIGEKTGENILFRKKTLNPGSYEVLRQKLFTARNKRPRPERDEKILTDWNGLMIAALARAAQALDNPSYGEAATRAAQFILTEVTDSSGKLLHRWYKKEAGLHATAADYAYFIWGLIELYQWNFDVTHLQEALRLTESFIDNYWDKEQGGFFLTSSEAEALLVRPKDFHDGALPSANAVAMLNLLRLSRLTANNTYEERAVSIVKTFADTISISLGDFSMFMTALEFALRPGYEVVIVGNQNDADTVAMFKALRKKFLPAMVLLFKPTDNDTHPITTISPFTSSMRALNNKASAYVCTGFNCKFPTTDIDAMLDLLHEVKLPATH